MSMIPFYRQHAWNTFDDPLMHQGFEPRFGMGLLPTDFMSSGMHHLPTGYTRPWSLAKDLAIDQKNLHFGKDGFQACVDVHHFKPKEVTIKTVDHTVVIEGKHEERDDEHGTVLRHFVRKYIMPKEYDMATVHSSLSSDGILTIKAPPPASTNSSERHVPIAHSALPAHMSLKDNKPNGV